MHEDDAADPIGRRAGLSRFEIVKDTTQEITESAATRIGRILGIVTGAVREVAHELGEWASDVIDAREAAGRAERAGRGEDRP